MNLRTLSLLTLVAILGASCTAATSGIFASLQVEQKVATAGSGLSAYATVTHMAEFTNSSSVDKYVVTGGQSMFASVAGSSAWSKLTVPQDTSDPVYAVGTTASSGTMGNRLWAIVGSTTGSPSPLTLYSTTDGSTWTASSLSGGETPTDLIPVRSGSDGYSSTELILVTSVSGNMNHIYFINNAGTLYGPLVLTGTGTTTLTSLSAPVVSAVRTGSAGSTYYFASESFLWTLNGAINASTATTTQTTPLQALTVTGGPNTGYGGIFYYSSQLYLSTTRSGSTGGGLYYASPSGTTVSFSAINGLTNVENSNGYPVNFGQWLYNDINGDFWIATGPTTTYAGTGYMELSLNGGTLNKTPLTNASNYSASLLYEYAVGVLFRGSSDMYYLGTLAEGLWYWNIASNSTNPWTQD